MKKFFEINEEKITEKAFSRSLIMSVLCILLCTVALCSVTYAWFSGEVESDTNKIKAGNFTLEVLVATSDNGTTTDVTPTSTTDEAYNYTLDIGTYQITLTPEDTAITKGHCIVEMYGVEHHTSAIISDKTANKDGYTENAPFTFELNITEDGTSVSFKSVWGVNVDPMINAEDAVYSADSWKNATGD